MHREYKECLGQRDLEVSPDQQVIKGFRALQDLMGRRVPRDL